MSWVLGNWVRLIPWVMGFLALLCGWAYVHHENAVIEGIRQNLAVAEANGGLAEKLARTNAAALDMAARQHAADMSAVQNHYRRQLAAEKATAFILESIDHAPSSDDGPVAPVLMRSLDCLRQRPGGPVGTGGSDCAVGGPGGVDGMPGRS